MDMTIAVWVWWSDSVRNLYSVTPTKKSSPKWLKVMTQEDAQEFFEFNQFGAWVGEGTPCFLF